MEKEAIIEKNKKFKFKAEILPYLADSNNMIKKYKFVVI